MTGYDMVSARKTVYHYLDMARQRTKTHILQKDKNQKVLMQKEIITLHRGG